MPSSKPVYNADGSYNYAFTLFGSTPSTTLAYIAVAIFLVATGAHLVQLIRHRTTYMVPALLGALFEAIGYGIRIKSIHDPFNTDVYGVQQLFIVVAPVLVAASQYVILGEIMECVNPRLAPVRPNLVAKIFVSSDVVSFVVQAAGAALLIVDAATYLHTAAHIIVAGLAVQIASFAAFLLLAAVYYVRARRPPPNSAAAHDTSSPDAAAHVHPRWPLLYAVLATGAIAVLLRCMYRIVSFGASLSLGENYAYGFDALPMALALFAMVFVHPGFYLGRRSKKPAVGADLELQ
ncbi:hypothetical protein HK405_014345 [Cladochytrium tenue]|nr:hypothetical protein HK405_014345 [Cladochytrium tenue]